MDLCSTCFIPCSQRCADCNNGFYCSEEHQEEHKKNCHPFKVVTLIDKGRVLIATREMAPYSIILHEQSIISLPNDKDNKFLGQICISCYKVSERLMKTCSKCSAPVCGRDCEVAEIHANYECTVFPIGRATTYRKRTSCLKLMAIIRCLLLKGQDRGKYNILMTLQSNKEHFLADKSAAVLYKQYTKTVELIFKEAGRHEYDEDEIHKVIGIIDTNSMLSPIPEKAGNGRSSMHLYAKTSMASHSCFPNARKVIENSGQLMLIATRPIVFGEEITVAYCYLNEGTIKRQKRLRAGYHFSCNCIRCQDPTELGTNFSSVKCPLCLDGYFLPKLRWDSEQNLDTEQLWMCNGCSNKNTDPQIRKLFVTLNNQLVELRKNKTRYTPTMETIALLRGVIDNYSRNILHPNHYELFALEVTLAEIMHKMIDLGERLKINISREEIFSLKKTLAPKCRALLTFWNKLFPGPSKHRGQMLYMLWKGLEDATYNQTIATFTSQPQQLRFAIPDFINEQMVVAKEAVQILSLEPDGSTDQVCVNNMNGWIRMVQQYIEMPHSFVHS